MSSRFDHERWIRVPGDATPDVIELKRVLTVAETAQLLNLCQKTIYALGDKGVLQTLPHVRKRLITRQSLYAFIDSAGSTS